MLAILTEPPGAAAGGIVIVHGLGVHPDWGLIGGLRTGLADAGYVTLSVQMPVLAANATRDDYAADAARGCGADRRRGRLSSRQGHREDRDRFAQHGRVDGECVSGATRRVAIDAWAPIGMFGAFAVPPKEPVLDVVAETEIAPVRDIGARARSRHCRRMRARARSRSPAPTIISNSQQKELVAAIAAFLERAFAGRVAVGSDRSSR